MRNLDNGVDSLEDTHRGQNAGRKLDPTVEWLDSLGCIRIETNVFCGSPVAQRQSIRLLIENFKSHNSFLWRQLTASGTSPNNYFLSPRCPQHCFRPFHPTACAKSGSKSHRRREKEHSVSVPNALEFSESIASNSLRIIRPIRDNSFL